jgi:hypothetical protein
MSNNQPKELQRDTATIVISSLIIILAVGSLWDTTHMLDPDSYVFPRAIAIAMIVFCIALIVRHLIKPRKIPEPGQANVSTLRRVSLVAAMLACCLAMPWLGFLIPGIATFLLLMWIAMWDKWTTTRLIVYPLVAVAIVVGFYTLFGNILQVPLPVGTLFE